MSQCFSVSIDELAKDELSLSQTATNITDPQSQCSVKTGQKAGQKIAPKTVLWLCILDVVGLVVVGIIMLVAHSTAEHINTSSVITLNSTGILTLLFIIFVGMGVFLLLKNK